MVSWVRDEFRGKEGKGSFYGRRTSVVVVWCQREQDPKMIIVTNS